MGNIVWHHATVTRARREAQNGHRGAIVWFTGLSGSGKSTLAHAVEEALHQQGHIGSRETFLKYVDEIFERRWLNNNGPMVQEFEHFPAGICQTSISYSSA